MRKSPAVVAVLVALLVSACSTSVPGVASPDPVAKSQGPVVPTAAPGALGKAFVDAQRRFSLAPPTGWKTDTSGTQGTAVVFLAPTAVRGFTANVNVFVTSGGFTLEQAVSGVKQELFALNGYSATTDEAVTLADGTPAHLIGGTFNDLSSGLALRNVQLFTVHDNRTVVATGTALQSDWPTYEQPLLASLRSLSVTS